jgi:hypothetical protein
MKAYYYESVAEICSHLPKIVQDWMESKSIALKMEYMLEKERKKEQQVERERERERERSA